MPDRYITDFGAHAEDDGIWHPSRGNGTVRVVLSNDDRSLPDELCVPSRALGDPCEVTRTYKCNGTHHVSRLENDVWELGHRAKHVTVELSYGLRSELCASSE